MVQRGPSFVAAPGPPAAMPATPVATQQQVSAQVPAAVPQPVATAPMPRVMQSSPSIVQHIVAPAPKEVSVPPSMHGISVEYAAQLERRLADLEIANASKTHSAFVFIKPHAVTEPVKSLVKDTLAQVGIFVLSEGVIQADEIDQNRLIDTHYGAIAAKAVTQAPVDLVVQPAAQEQFEQVFGIRWEEALQQGLVFNAMDAARKLGISPDELGMRWGTLTKGVDMLKFGGGFYCGRLDDIYVVNGFYMDMRAKFTTPGTSIYYMEVEWDARVLTWSDFRGRVLGATDPSTAAEGSIRHSIYVSWDSLGLAACPDTGDNGVHASASPFEALAERANWLNMSIESDFFGKALMANGLPLATIEEWCKDPAVTFEQKRQSLFDLLEDLNARDCLQKAADIAAENA